jgi:malate dehydrogenase (oxaloacetate-decarboxylating)
LFKSREVVDENGIAQYIETELTGIGLLESAQLNKGTAFNNTERDEFSLKGLLPPAVETMEDQLQRAYKQYSIISDDLQKNIFLNNLYNINETLFFRLISVTHLIGIQYIFGVERMFNGFHQRKTGIPYRIV